MSITTPILPVRKKCMKRCKVYRLHKLCRVLYTKHIVGRTHPKPSTICSRFTRQLLALSHSTCFPHTRRAQGAHSSTREVGGHLTTLAALHQLCLRQELCLLYRPHAVRHRLMLTHRTVAHSASCPAWQLRCCDCRRTLLAVAGVNGETATGRCLLMRLILKAKMRLTLTTLKGNVHR